MYNRWHYHNIRGMSTVAHEIIIMLLSLRIHPYDNAAAVELAIPPFIQTPEMWGDIIIVCNLYWRSVLCLFRDIWKHCAYPVLSGTRCGKWPAQGKYPKIVHLSSGSEQKGSQNNWAFAAHTASNNFLIFMSCHNVWIPMCTPDYVRRSSPTALVVLQNSVMW